MLRRRLLARLIAVVVRLLGPTWRVRRLGPDPFSPPQGTSNLAALWHSDLLLAAWLYRDRDVRVPVSLSRDGQLVDEALGHLGFNTARGSSSRGGHSLLRSLIRAVDEGETVAVLADGPRGPAGVAKAGVVAVASACGASIVPVAFRARPAWRAGSWDRTQIPAPFARVICSYGEPVQVPKGVQAAEREKVRAELERSIHAAGEEAEANLR